MVAVGDDELDRHGQPVPMDTGAESAGGVWICICIYIYAEILYIYIFTYTYYVHCTHILIWDALLWKIYEHFHDS